MYQIHRFETVTSTNDILQQLASQGAPAGTAVLADAQTAGRGRMGRSFYSPSGTGLYLSVLLRPQLAPQDVLALTPMAAVAAAEAISAVTGIETQIKWVNDLLLDGKKVCGILAQSQCTAAGSVEYVMLGVGINLAPPKADFPADIAGIAGALYPALTPERAAELRTALADEICTRLMEESAHLLEKRYLAAYRERLCVLGKPVTVLENEIESEATALDIDDDLRLLVRYADGREAWRSTGEIRIRQKMGR